jgi:4-methyl-5(b-hydroxyethyl)-thiazole monophosphate biosynthesis
MAKTVLVLLADGFEEVEALTPVDYLRRAGAELSTVAIGENTCVRGSHSVPVIADTTLRAVLGKPGSEALCDAVVLPGGGRGAENLHASIPVGNLLKRMASLGKLVGAICASPAIVLSPLGLLKGRQWTCFPGMENSAAGGKEGWTADPVVVDNGKSFPLITSRGAGTAGLFSKALIAALFDQTKADEIAKRVVMEF